MQLSAVKYSAVKGNAVQCIAWMCGAGPTVRGLIVTLPGQGENSDQGKGRHGLHSDEDQEHGSLFCNQLAETK